MKAYVFPGQGAQYTGMGKDLYDRFPLAKEMFETANTILGFHITDIMFTGSEDDLKRTSVTQPAIFLHSTILAAVMGKKFIPDMVAGHSLGEFSALAATNTLSFENGLILVSKRASAMQKACEMAPSAMAAVIGAEDKLVEFVCSSIDEIVVPANYNSPGQLVISGSVEGIDRAIDILMEKGVKRVIKLAVNGAFHSPFMEPARSELEEAITNTHFNSPNCPVYQNATALPSTEPGIIKSNLIAQLTSPVLWTQSVEKMISDGASSFTEVGPGNVLQGLVKKIDKDIITEAAAI